jgi:hypothetical protein
MLFLSILKKLIFDGNDWEIRKHRSLAHPEEVSIFVKQNFSVKGILSADDQDKLHLEAK